jgi:hypothetical protein
MSDPTGQFVAGLSGQQQVLPRGITGVVRCDLKDGDETEHWYVTIRKGDVAVSRQGDEADCVLTADKATFDAIASGQMNATAALLRGALAAQGEIILLAALQRLFPAPPDAHDRPIAGYARRTS